MTYIKIRVHADSKENRLIAKNTDHYEIWVKAPPERGLANAAVLSLLAQHLGVPIGVLRIIKGAHSPAKIVSIAKNTAQ